MVLMIKTLRRNTLTTVVAIGAAGLGGAAIAGAASNGKASSGSAAAQHQRAQQQQLSAADAAKVKQAAIDKVPGSTVLRTEAGGPYSTPYHAHIKTSDGKLQVVLVDASFQATAVQADNGRGGGRGDHGGRGHGAETPLTGVAKSKVEAAVFAKYAGATIERT